MGEVSPWGPAGRCFAGAQRAGPFLLIFIGRLDPYPLLGAAGQRPLQDSRIRWAHPRTFFKKKEVCFSKRDEKRFLTGD